MELFQKVFSAIKPASHLGDIVDELNYRFMVFILVFCSVVVMARQFAFQPIQCWVPAEFSQFWEEYAENYCWVQNTYFVSSGEDLPESLRSRREREIGYYQWTGFILIIQAFFFYVPFLIWISLNSVSGINVNAVQRMAADCLTTDVRVREKLVETLSCYLSGNIRLVRFRKRSAHASTLDAYFRPAYVTGIYLFVKILYTVNAIGQFYFLNAVLGTRNTLYGLGLWRHLLDGSEWENSGFFPRVTYCDFQVRALGQLRSYTVQCVLPTNMINEKIFLLLWFFLFIVAALNCLNFVWWLARMTIPVFRLRFIKSLLMDLSTRPESTKGPAAKAVCVIREGVMQQKPSATDRYGRLVHHFLNRFLLPDGEFLVRMIYTNYGAVIAADVVKQIWEEFYDHRSSAPALLLKLADSSGAHQKPDKVVASVMEQDQSGMFFDEEKVSPDHPTFCPPPEVLNGYLDQGRVPSPQERPPPVPPRPEGLSMTHRLATVNVRSLNGGQGPSNGHVTPPTNGYI